MIRAVRAGSWARMSSSPWAAPMGVGSTAVHVWAGSRPSRQVPRSAPAARSRCRDRRMAGCARGSRCAGGPRSCRCSTHSAPAAAKLKSTCTRSVGSRGVPMSNGGAVDLLEQRDPRGRSSSISITITPSTMARSTTSRIRRDPVLGGEQHEVHVAFKGGVKDAEDEAHLLPAGRVGAHRKDQGHHVRALAAD